MLRAIKKAYLLLLGALLAQLAFLSLANAAVVYGLKTADILDSSFPKTELFRFDVNISGVASGFTDIAEVTISGAGADIDGLASVPGSEHNPQLYGFELVSGQSRLLQIDASTGVYTVVRC